MTAKQKKTILDIWNSRKDNPPSIEEIRVSIFGENLDDANKKDKEIKKFLADCSPKVEKPKELTDEQKKYVETYYKTNSSRVIAEEIFGRKMQTASKEVRLVVAHIHRLQGKGFSDNEDRDYTDETWTPPKRVSEAIARVNKYIFKGLEPDKVKNYEKRCMQSLIKYLHNHSFNVQINTYKKRSDRELFESSVIENTYLKPDLEPEELTQYIYLAREEVNAANLSKRVEALQSDLDSRLKEESGKIPMNLVETIEKITKEYNQCCVRKNQILNNLVQKRSRKLERRKNIRFSVIDLVRLWKNYEDRRQMLQIGKDEEKETKEEVERLKNLDDVKARIMGLSEREAVYG